MKRRYKVSRKSIKRRLRNKTRSNRKFKGGDECDGLKAGDKMLCKRKMAVTSEPGSGDIRKDGNKYYNGNQELKPHLSIIEQDGATGIFEPHDTFSNYYIENRVPGKSSIRQLIDPTKSIKFKGNKKNTDTITHNYYVEGTDELIDVPPR